MATPVEEKKMMSGLAANFTEFGCAVGFGLVLLLWLYYFNQ